MRVRVKLSGEGTNVGKHLNVINITFTILDEGSKAMSADGNQLVAVKVPEDYDHLFVALGDIQNDVEQLSTVCIDNVCYEIEWFPGGDWKFLACICGLGATDAKTFCYMKIKKDYAIIVINVRKTLKVIIYSVTYLA